MCIREDNFFLHLLFFEESCNLLKSWFEATNFIISIQIKKWNCHQIEISLIFNVGKTHYEV